MVSKPLLLSETMPFILHTITSCEGEHTTPPGKKVSQSDVCAQKGLYFLKRVFSFYPRGSRFLCDYIPVCASTPISVLLGRETGKGLHLLLSKFCLVCPATVPFYPVSRLPPFLYSGSKSVCQEVHSAFVSPHLGFHFTSGLRPFICR